MKLMPGVRLNFSKNTVGMSFGVPGARYTINSKGRKTLSTGIPGTGIYNVETLSSGSRDTGKMMLDDSAEQNVVQNRVPPSPGFFARKAERELNSFLHDIYDLEDTDAASSVIEKAVALRKKYDELRYSLELISFLHGITDEKWRSRPPPGAQVCGNTVNWCSTINMYVSIFQESNRLYTFPKESPLNYILVNRH